MINMLFDKKDFVYLSQIAYEPQVNRFAKMIEEQRKKIREESVERIKTANRAGDKVANYHRRDQVASCSA